MRARFTCLTGWVVTVSKYLLTVLTYLLRPVSPMARCSLWSIGHWRLFDSALCSGLFLLLLSSWCLAASAQPQCLASSYCEAGLSSSYPAGSSLGLGVWCWMPAPEGVSDTVSKWHHINHMHVTCSLQHHQLIALHFLILHHAQIK